MSGEFTKLPPSGRIAAVNNEVINWDDLVLKCQSNPGEVLLAGNAVPETTIKSLRQRVRAPFVKDGGHLVINQRNYGYNETTGKPEADVFFTWVLDDSNEEK